MPTALDPRLNDIEFLRLAGLRRKHRQQQQREGARLRWPTGEQSPDADTIRTACEYDQERFARTFFPDICSSPFNALHRQFFAKADARNRQQERGWRDATAAPRGSAKTSIKKIQVVHDLLYGHEKYIGIGSANFDHARDKVKDIRLIPGKSMILSWRILVDAFARLRRNPKCAASYGKERA